MRHIFPYSLNLLWLPALFFLLPFIYVYFFCVPFGDDFDEATKALFIPDLPGALYDTGRNWLTWSGRYAYHFCAVLFAAAIRQPALFSIACFLPILLYSLTLLKFTPLITNFPRFLFMVFCLLAFYSNFYNLWCFYNYMDSFSAILQWCAFFLFVYYCQRLYLRETKTIFACALSGLFAIGIYETAALAVFWTALGYWLADALRLSHSRSASFSLRKFMQLLKNSPFWPLQFWLWGGLLFSFMAPGNFMRSAIRYVPLDEKLLKLAEIIPLGLAIIKKFFLDFWGMEIFAIISLAALFPTGKSPDTAKHSLPLIFLPPALWLLFYLSASLLLAFSDASLSIDSKFQDIFSCCLGLAFAFCLFPIIRLLARRLRLSRPSCIATSALLAAMLFSGIFLSRNFQITAINAANGEIARYSRFYRNQEQELKVLAAAYDGQNSWAEFGFIGELKNPSARSIRAIPDKPQAILDEWPGGGFPVWHGRVFQRNAKTWPNERASWLYNVGSLKAAFPNPAKAFSEDNGSSCFPTGRLAKAGIKEIRLIKAPGFGEKPFLWVLVKHVGKPYQRLQIFIPAQISLERLLPLPLQEFLYQSFKSKQTVKADLAFALTGSILPATQEAAFQNWQLFPAPGYFSIPEYIYISLGGKIFDKIPATKQVSRLQKNLARLKSRSHRVFFKPCGTRGNF